MAAEEAQARLLLLVAAEGRAAAAKTDAAAVAALASGAVVDPAASATRGRDKHTKGADPALLTAGAPLLGTISAAEKAAEARRAVDLAMAGEEFAREEQRKGDEKKAARRALLGDGAAALTPRTKERELRKQMLITRKQGGGADGDESRIKIRELSRARDVQRQKRRAEERHRQRFRDHQRAMVEELGDGAILAFLEEIGVDADELGTRDALVTALAEHRTDLAMADEMKRLERKQRRFIKNASRVEKVLLEEAKAGVSPVQEERGTSHFYADRLGAGGSAGGEEKKAALAELDAAQADLTARLEKIPQGAVGGLADHRVSLESQLAEVAKRRRPWEDE